MAFTDIFKRKKKQPDFVEIGSMAEQGSYGPAGYPKKEADSAEVDLGLPQMPQQQQMFAPQNNTAELEKEIKALSYKIDNLKNTLDTISARLINIENAIKGQPPSGQEGGEGWTY